MEKLGIYKVQKNWKNPEKIGKSEPKKFRKIDKIRKKWKKIRKTSQIKFYSMSPF